MGLTKAVIPIDAAKQIAEAFKQNQVIVVAWDNANQEVSIVTYGTDRESSVRAAQGGNFVKEALGWPDRLCHDTPSWWKEGLEEIGRLADTAENFLSATELPVSDSIHVQGLKTGLREILIKLKAIYEDLSNGTE